MNPAITKMEHFVIIDNGFYLFAIVAKSSILNVVGFQGPPLHCTKFAAKAVEWLNKLEKHVLGSLILLHL